ncbi:uncharacterized protein [Rutidosis leptorrhynchoides]|uniref:uncharacterized protein n=1 Tax=Rutidosis leptorrhynchoides TaxID=125765 RepID=UPI003A990CF8
MAVFFADITESYELQADIRLMRFADYFGRAFANVSASQFPWMKILKEASVEKMIDIPLSQISEDVYRTAADWLNDQPIDALGSFVVWCLDILIADLTLQQGTIKGSKKVVQQAPSKSQLLGCQGDLVVGLFMWAHLLLPIACKSGCNPQSRDLILQLVERIVSSPKARTILVNGAVRKGERVVTPTALELLMGPTFPTTPARVKVALAVAPGSKAMKQLTQQLLPIAAKAAGQGKSALAGEASDLFIWCLSQNADCYKQWGNIYVDNLEASVVVFRKLAENWMMQSNKLSSLDHLKEALKSFRDKNEKALASSIDEVLIKEADKHCKTILSKFSGGNRCLKATAFLTVSMAVGVAWIINDPRVWNLKDIAVVLLVNMGYDHEHIYTVTQKKYKSHCHNFV